MQKDRDEARAVIGKNIGLRKQETVDGYNAYIPSDVMALRASLMGPLEGSSGLSFPRRTGINVRTRSASAGREPS